MTEKNDFTWGKDRINKNGNIGKIVVIPPECGDEEKEGEEISFARDEDVDFEVDEFKEKTAEKLSRELHKDQS